MGPINVRPVIQQTRFCGPATLEILYSFFRLDVPQERIAALTGIPIAQIRQHGCSLQDLSTAVQALGSDHCLLARYDSTVDDLYDLVEAHGVPAGVEWRCVFQEPDGRIWGEGHYSVVVGVDRSARTLQIVDPHDGRNLSHRDGIVGFDAFTERWWDENWLPIPGQPGEFEQIWTQGLLFALIPASQEAAYRARGLTPMSVELARRHRAAPRVIDLPTTPEEAIPPPPGWQPQHP